MTYSYFLILLMQKQTQKGCLMSKVAQLKPGSTYRFPDFIFQMSATIQRRSFCSLDTDLPQSLLHQLAELGSTALARLLALREGWEKAGVKGQPLLTWRAFLQCGFGCGCWGWWRQQRRDHSSRTWKAGHWSEWPRGSSVLKAGKRTGSSDHIGKVWNK